MEVLVPASGSIAKICPSNRGRMHCGDARIAGKIRRVEGKNVGQTMHLHPSHKARIMHLHPLHSVGDDQLPPLGMNGGVVGKQSKETLNQPGGVFRLRQAKPEPAARGRGARADVPELNQVLGQVAAWFALSSELLQGGANKPMVRVCRAYHTKKDVAVQEIGH